MWAAPPVSRRQAPCFYEGDDLKVAVQLVPGRNLKAVHENAGRAAQSQNVHRVVSSFTYVLELLAFFQALGHTFSLESQFLGQRDEVRSGLRQRLPGLHALEHLVREVP